MIPVNIPSMASSIQEAVADYKREVNEKLTLHKYPLHFLNDENGKVNTSLSNAHNADQNLNAIFHELLSKIEGNKNLDIVDLCEKYSQERESDRLGAFTYFSHLLTQLEKRNWLFEKRREEAYSLEEKPFDDKELREGDFTQARRAIAIELLLKEAGSRIEYGIKGVNKTAIAEFVEFLISDKRNPLEQIRGTMLHKRIEAKWDRLSLAEMNDLIYVKKQFQRIKLTNMVSQIDEIIRNQESEKY